MYAIVEINGQQFKVEAGKKLFVHHIQNAENGATVEFDKVLLVDKDGNVVPDTSLPVKIACSGKGTVIASGNAAYDDMKSFRSLTPNTFRGRAIAIVQPTEEKGEIRVTVSAEGMEDASVLIHAE